MGTWLTKVRVGGGAFEMDKGNHFVNEVHHISKKIPLFLVQQNMMRKHHLVLV